MLQPWVILLASFAYIGVLFAIARYGDRRADAGRSVINNPYVYALSLGVYCTAWTFYGSVGRAATSGVGFLPVYLGPTLMAALWMIILRKMIRISRTHRITSIADFISSRYGKSPLLGGLVVMVAVAGIVPYIALQLKAVSTSYLVLIQHPQILMPDQLGTMPVWQDTAYYVALLMAMFAILFGTRHLDVTEHHQGLVLAVAFESVVKLLAFLAVGIFITYGVYDGFGDVFAQASENPALRRLFTLGEHTGTFGDWAWLTGLSMLAVLFLPRQFQMAVVENMDEAHLRKAAWLFPLYLLVINIFVLPIAFGGLLHFPNGGVDADTFVLTVPMAENAPGLALLVFIGGLSAATSMVIVATVALSTMVSNDLLIPLLLQLRSLRLSERSNLGGLILIIRRGAIIAILMLGYLYFRLVGESTNLVSIGLISFAAVAQFAPAILGGIFWKGGSRRGATLGLFVGFVIWAFTLPIPAAATRPGIQMMVETGLWGLSWLRPYALFGLEGWDPVSHALFWSLLTNTGLYVMVSLWGEQSVLERSQAVSFVDIFEQASEERFNVWRGQATVQALRDLLSRILGQARAERELSRYAQEQDLDLARMGEADPTLVSYTERVLAGAVGAASARAAVASVVQEEPIGIDEVMRMLDETSRVIAYSQQLEKKSQELQAATGELRAANRQLKELDQLKDEFISTVTHELRTPLTSIRAFSEILNDNPDLPVTQRGQFTGIIMRESERLTRLVNQVLDLSKIESGTFDWQITPVDMVDVVRESVTATGQLFNERGIQPSLDLPASVPTIHADRDRLMQVMLNLISNAIKFCDPHAGEVGVQLVHEPGRLRVAVSDNGMGIRPADHHIVFEKFRQVGGNTTTDKPQGTGLGLPISRHIVTHFGGDLWVESEPGHGATFMFTVPLDS
jgi:Na+/proline symporter/nitrogen-specific signal transduction histidine kinase